MKRYKIFISSVQSEFREERRDLKAFLLQDPIIKDFVESVFIFEDIPAVQHPPSGIFLPAIGNADIYIGLFGQSYGNADADGISPTEREYDLATKKGLVQWIYFFDKKADVPVVPQMAALRKKAEQEHTRRRVDSIQGLIKEVYSTFVDFLRANRLLAREPFDVSEAEGMTLRSLDRSRLDWFAKKAIEARGFPSAMAKTVESLLVHLRLMRNKRLTRAAVLLFGKDPRSICLSSMVKCVFCAGTVYRRPFVQQVYEGDVFNQIDQAVLFILSHIDRTVGLRTKSMEAEITYDIPVDVVREAIVNAVAHRDYTSNASVEVRLFSDRLEVWNPGVLPEGLTIADLYRQHPSIPFNPLIADALYLAKYIERAGSGTDMMLSLCKKRGLPRPEFKCESGFFVTTIRRFGGDRAEDSASGLQSRPESRPELRPESRPESLSLASRILNALVSGAKSRSVIAFSLGQKTGSGQFKKVIVELLTQGMIERTIPEKPNSRLQKYKLTSKGTMIVKDIHADGKRGCE